MVKINDKYQHLFELPKEVRYYIITGGRGCFSSNQNVVTDKGIKNISDIKNGEKVLSYNHEKKITEYKEVINTFKYDNEKLIRIKLKNGSYINVTENHKFFNRGEYISIKDLLSLWYGNMEKNKMP
jgi:intein/homing endonuclease